jgi:hypothetical protein
MESSFLKDFDYGGIRAGPSPVNGMLLGSNRETF